MQLTLRRFTNGEGFRVTVFHHTLGLQNIGITMIPGEIQSGIRRLAVPVGVDQQDFGAALGQRFGPEIFNQIKAPLKKDVAAPVQIKPLSSVMTFSGYRRTRG